MMQTAPLQSVAACRSCQTPGLINLRAFGDTPLADRLQDPAKPTPDYRAPMTLCHCPACGLCQIRETVDPGILFGADYPYFSSVSPALMTHFENSAQAIMARGVLDKGGLVMEAASNDGYMLAPFRAAGHAVLGIDPADGPVAQARARGIDTVHDFFSADLARKLAAKRHRAQVFLANNVLAHVADVNDFMAGVATLLAPDGLVVMEFPSLLELVDRCAFDTIYHQHLLYLSLTAACPIFERAGLYVNDAEATWVHGGSLRVFASRTPGQTDRLRAMLRDEAERNVISADFYATFLERIETLISQTQAGLADLRAQGKTIAAYGAAAKGTTLLHMLDLPDGTLQAVYDKSQWKHGLEMPGSALNIRPPSQIITDAPDALLILAWNFADEIIAENAAYLAAGGRFVIPVPDYREVTA